MDQFAQDGVVIKPSDNKTIQRFIAGVGPNNLNPRMTAFATPRTVRAT
jgi:hypothetical protein